MPKWTLGEARTVIDGTGHYKWYPDHLKNKIASARIAAFLYRQKHKLPVRGAPDLNKSTIRSKNRRVSNLARRIIVRAKRGAGLRSVHDCHPSLLLARRKDSIFLDGLLPNRELRWVPLATRLKTQFTTKIRVENFSFLKNPVGTMKALKAIAKAEEDCISAQIDFMDRTCADIGPWLVLGSGPIDRLEGFVAA